ncbi:hypothetical protein RRG08_022207 [Elysia crispata]|uniref:Uncharacterized protein n=1 Tax=Elysia crispata TaxID=231223 RepID=A0AAE1D738_9GAST|nr:hypothetical protein RRG08_022207 [Elysia crispata]
MREAISPHQRLTATLRFLATGANYQDLKFSACISAPSLCQIIPETCSAIYDALVADYMNLRARQDQSNDLKAPVPQFTGCLPDGKYLAAPDIKLSGTIFVKPLLCTTIFILMD